MASRLSKLRKAAEREHARRATAGNAALLARVTAEALSAGHAKQLAMVRDAALYMIVLCSRRAGKTYGLAVLSLLTALSAPRRNILYIGLSKPHARKFLWNEVWCPLLDTWKIPHKRLEDEMTTTFPNGSIVYVSGTDDVRHIESFLGNRLDLAIVDEAQGQADSVLVPLTTRILPNALLDDMDRPGKLVMSGTIPDVNAGRFMEVWNEGSWSPHNWNRFENPHLKNQEAALEAFLKANPGLKRESPEVQREWYGRFAFDSNATAYRYTRSLNGYVPTVPDWLEAERAALVNLGIPIASLMAAVAREGIDSVSAAIDPGSSDRTALTVFGWGRRARKVQHLFEWTTPRGAGGSLAAIGAVAGIVQRRLAPTWWHWDPGSGKLEIDTFWRDHGIPLIKAANKADLPGQVRRNNDLLTRDRLDVMIGSALEEDYQRARFDPDARARGQWRWASQWHPDPSECGRYALDPYWDTFEERDGRTPQQKAAAQFFTDDEDVEAESEGPPDALSRLIGWR